MSIQAFNKRLKFCKYSIDWVVLFLYFHNLWKLAKVILSKDINVKSHFMIISKAYTR